MTSVTLRPLTDEEYAGYRALGVAKVTAELVRARGIPQDTARARAEATFPATMADLLAEDGASMSRVLADGDPVGWLWLASAPMGAEGLHVNDVEIDEPYRGRGLGRATMLAAEAVARSGGHASLRLNVFARNTTATALYRSLGYQVEATQMSKRLGTGDPS